MVINARSSKCDRFFPKLHHLRFFFARIWHPDDMNKTNQAERLGSHNIIIKKLAKHLLKSIH